MSEFGVVISPFVCRVLNEVHNTQTVLFGGQPDASVRKSDTPEPPRYKRIMANTANLFDLLGDNENDTVEQLAAKVPVKKVEPAKPEAKPEAPKPGAHCSLCFRHQPPMH